jgi:hypothetical protein
MNRAPKSSGVTDVAIVGSWRDRPQGYWSQNIWAAFKTGIQIAVLQESVGRVSVCGKLG